MLRAIWGYCFLVLIVRTAGRRPGKQMAPFEFVFVFFAGSLTLTALVGNDRSLVNGVVIIITIAPTHFFLAFARIRWSTLGRIIDGTRWHYFKRGEWDTEAMQRMRIQDDDLMAMRATTILNASTKSNTPFSSRNGEISIVEKSD